MARKVAMRLRGPGNIVYTGYCFYDSQDRLQGWVLGDEVDALAVAEWLTEKIKEDEAKHAKAMAEIQAEKEAKPKRTRKPKPVVADLPPMPEMPEEPEMPGEQTE